MNTIELSYENEDYKDFAPNKEIKGFLGKICDVLSLKNCEFSVSFVSEKSIHTMNKEYRGIDCSTDILSFAVEDDVENINFVVPKRSKRNIGDMIICPEVLQKNAEQFNVTAQNELHRLLIHGMLHLIGENHNTNEPTEPMLIRQEEILKSIYKD